MKKISKIICSTTIAFALLISLFSNSAYAVSTQTHNTINNTSTNSSGLQLLSKETITISANTKSNLESSTYNNPEYQQVKKQLNNKLKKLSQKSLGLKNNNNIKSYNSINSYGEPIEISSITLFHTLYADDNTRSIISQITIQSIVGQLPNLLAFSQIAYYHDSNVEPSDGKNSYDIQHCISQAYLGAALNDIPKVGDTYTQIIPASTHWWGYYGMASASYSNPDGTTSSPNVYWDKDKPNTPNNRLLINRTGHTFPDYTDPWSGKKASDGLRTDWTPLTKEQANANCPYDSGKDRQIAIANYIDKYHNPNYEWHRDKLPYYYEMHHMRPRQFGGTNDESNFMPVPYLSHIPISNWFKGYADPNDQGNTDPTDE